MKMLSSSSKKAIDGHPVAARDTCLSNMSESIEETKAAFLVHLIFQRLQSINGGELLSCASIRLATHTRGTIARMQCHNIINSITIDPSIPIKQTSSTTFHDMTVQLMHHKLYHSVQPHLSKCLQILTSLSEIANNKSCEAENQMDTVSVMIQLEEMMDKHVVVSTSECQTKQHDDIEFDHIADTSCWSCI